MVGIFLTVLIDLLGFGLVIPDIQIRGEALGARGATIGILLATYSIAQFLFAPLLGRISDSKGRRMILVVTSVFSLIAMLVYSQADQLWVMFLARALWGLSAANLGVAYAYVADITPPEQRAGRMGMLGAAFGIGFIFGPVIGTLLSKIDHARQLHALGIADGAVLTEAQKLLQFQGKPLVLGLAAAGMALLNLIFILRFVPEPERHEQTGEGARFNIAGLKKAFSSPALGLLLLLFFTANYAFTNLETTYFRLAKAQWGLLPEMAVFMLLAVGIATAAMQGGIVRRLLKKHSETSLLRVSYLVQTPMLALVPFVPIWIPQIASSVVLGLFSGMAQPCLSSLISRRAPREMQGGVFGITQGLGAVARMIGPIGSNALFEIKPWVPYVFASGMMLIPLALSWKVQQPADEAPA